MKLLPAYYKGEVVAYAKVDDEDYPRLAGYRWNLDYHGYVRRGAGRSRLNLSLHRDVLGLVPGDGIEVDHIDADKLNNCRSNLRAGTHTDNQQNIRKLPGTSSRYLNVAWNKVCGKWQVQVQHEGRKFYLGLFEDEDEAGRVATEFRAAHKPWSAEARAAA